jgi:DNA polymerase-4
MARGMTLKLKLPNFHILQHSKSFIHPFQNLNQLSQAVRLLLAEMHIDSTLRFRLIGVAVYQLQNPIQNTQLNLWQ